MQQASQSSRAFSLPACAATTWAAVMAYWVGRALADGVFYVKHAGRGGLEVQYGLHQDAWWTRNAFQNVGGVLTAIVVVAAAMWLFTEARRWTQLLPVVLVVLLQPTLHVRWLRQQAERAVAVDNFTAGTAEQLATLRSARAFDQLLDGVKRSAPGSADAAVAMLRLEGGEAALKDLALDPAAVPGARIDAAFALASRWLTTPEIDDAIGELIDGPETDHRNIAMRLSADFAPRGANVRAWLALLLDDPDPGVRLIAATASINNGLSDPACTALEGLLTDDISIIRAKALTRLRACGEHPSARTEAKGDEAAVVLRGGTRATSYERYEWSLLVLGLARGERAAPILWTIHRCPSLAEADRTKAFAALQQIYITRNLAIPDMYTRFVSVSEAANRDPLLPAYCPA